MRRHLALMLLVCIASVLSGPASSADPDLPDRRCSGNPKLAGECFVFHGRLSLTNGTPGVRIWRVGTKRMLGVVPSENEIMPQCLRDHVAASTNVYGDFTVCPFTKQKIHEMQLVCVEATTEFLVEHLGAPDAPPALSRHPGCSKSP